MTAKEFFKRFRWGEVFPAALYFVIGVLTAAMYPSVSADGAAMYAYEFLTASLALLAGAAVTVYYFLGRNESVFYLLSGVGGLAVAVYLFVPTLVKRSVVPIALGIAAVLNGAAECYEGIRARKTGKWAIVRIVLGAVFASLGVVSCVRPCALLSDDWILTGVVFLAQAAAMFAFCFVDGLFEEEEGLKFRPVKKSGEEPQEEEPPESESGDAPKERGAHRR